MMIQEPLSLTVREVQARLEHCKDQCNYYRRNGKRYRRRHLEKRLEVARDEKGEEA